MEKFKIDISISKLIGLLILVLLIAFIAYHSNTNEKNDYQIPYTRHAAEEYWDLFPEKHRGEIHVSFSLTPKFRNQITQFTFDNKKFNIEVLKINSSTKPLNQIIGLSNQRNLNVNDIPYFKMGGHLFEVNYWTAPHNASSIKLYIDGDSTQTIVKNDSVLLVSSNFKTFSINYNDSEKSAIWAISDGALSNISKLELPINILFIKKHNIIYYLLMYANNRDTCLKSNMLWEIINAKISINNQQRQGLLRQ